MTEPAFNPKVQAALYDVLDNQLKDGDPPETRRTLERLLAAGIERDEARRLIACVIAGEIFSVLKTNMAFDRDRFVGRLSLLPEMPWMDDEPQ